MIETYIKKFSKLRSDKSRTRWVEATKYRAPHKPLLLLAIADLIAQGSIKTNFIKLKPILGELFTIYWSQVMPPYQRSNISLPFYHLKSEQFWHLIPKPNMEKILISSRQIRSVSQLNEVVAGAKLDEELYNLLCTEDSRNLLRTVLTSTYFIPELQDCLIEQGQINQEAFQYSYDLLKQKELKDTEANFEDKHSQSVRDQGFRRAIVTAYDYRCTLCGIRMLTPDGHTVVDAAHIIPWSISYNDNIRNGVALCRLCHWTFDEGLLGISSKYIVLTSKQLSKNHNIPSHLTTLSGRSIIGPLDEFLWPELDSLNWHYQKVFLKF